MKKTAFRYAVLRFMPYPETGEFANVGVVAAAPRENKFAFRIEKKRTKRLTDFFSNLDATMYKRAIKDYEAELVVMVDLVEKKKLKALEAFETLVQPRATAFQFAAAGAMLADSIEAGTNQIFNDQMHHAFASEPGYIRDLNIRVRSCLESLKLIRPFKKDKLEIAGYKVDFDFIQKDPETDKAIKVIKPFYMNYDELNSIYNLGDRWYGKFRRLEGYDLLPEETLFPVVEPKAGTLATDAWQKVKKDLQEYGRVISANDFSELQQFAED